MKEKLETIREACIRANKEIVEQRPTRLVKGKTSVPDNIGQEIRLADIFLAISKKVKDNREKTEILYDLLPLWSINKKWSWNLKEDSLDWHAKHRPETIEFIYPLVK